MLWRVPVIAVLVGLMAALMLAPALYAAVDGEWRIGRGFLYPSIFGFFLAAALATLLRPMGPRDTARKELVMLVLVWLALPVYASLPLVLLTPEIGTGGAWFESVTAITTTGGSVFTSAAAAPEAVHLWRGLVGWFGGLLTLMGAYVVLAPRRLGGYEVLTASATVAEARSIDLRLTGAAFQSRVARALRTILPVYVGMTLVLGLAFGLFGERGLVAGIHAMSIVSTSGITPLENGFAELRSFGAELVAVVFMVAAASRLLYSGAAQTGERAAWRRDPEIRLMLALAGAAALALFLSHWGVALVLAEPSTLREGAEALWGALFTAVSFVTTTGFKSFAWTSAGDWSGLANPGLVLLGLATVGGGAATTAGGVKMIRTYALLRHGLRELERIAVPHSVHGAEAGNRGLRREGAVVAWAFMMLFLLALMVTVLALTLVGERFDRALIAAVAALSNIGPAFEVIAGEPLGFAAFSPAERVILAVAMVLGRIETIAVIALFNPLNWPRRQPDSKITGNVGAESPLLERHDRARPRTRRRVRR